MKQEEIGLVSIIAFIVMLLLTFIISNLLGGFHTPYVPSLAGILLLISFAILAYGIDKSLLGIRGNILIILILFFSAIFSLLSFLNKGYELNIYSLIIFIILVISTIICLAYLLSQFTDNVPLKDKLSVVGDKSSIFCIGLIVIFFACVFLSNSVPDPQGHVVLDSSEISIIEKAPDTVAADDYSEYEDYDESEDAQLMFDFKFNLDNVTWEDRSIDTSIIQKGINSGSVDAVVYLYDDDGNCFEKVPSTLELDGNNVLIQRPQSKTDLSYALENNVEFAVVHLIDEDTGFDISSNKCEIQMKTL
jgi:hypothetical protein